ncbi:MAG: presqualene diphosphate synthase HpnD, partial [Pseudomonadota bacterium]|nr:presqualene diphosphate synthase HpnD [Pseudomonadota bacterium]
MTPEEYCKNKTRHSGSSFYHSFKFLPKEKKLAITALYAFCREIDDVVDQCADLEIARIKLSWWRQELVDTYKGQAHHPVTKALWPSLSKHGIPRENLEEIITGVEMDLTANRYPVFEDLQFYCYKVAGVVGILSATLFGYSNSQTIEYAKKLGTAFQLTNIIRDVGEDARLNRIYLPMEDLAKFNVPATDILKAQNSEQFYQLMKFQADRARQFYKDAFKLLPDEDRKNQTPGLIMAAIYSALLDEIEKDGFNVLKYKIALPPMRKIWITFRV